MSSDRLGVSEPRPAEEVIQSLNVRVLHRHLGHFGITEVSTEVSEPSFVSRATTASLISVETEGGDGLGLLESRELLKVSSHQNIRESGRSRSNFYIL